MYDILIKNGLVLDGTGSPTMRVQVAVKDGKIAKIARNISENAKTVIDAFGKVVTPGFIDSHSHSDGQFATCPLQTDKIEQGITTSIAGQCGGSVCGKDAAEFLDHARGVKLGANMALLIGHGTLRRAVMGTQDRTPTAQELEEMKQLLRSAMEHGALGVSFGLIYAPGCFAKTDELIEIAKVAGEYQGIAAIHLRSESTELVKAVGEFITIVRQSGVRGVVSHHKAAGLSENWGKIHTTMRMIDRANEEGLEIYMDVYPYIAASSKFSTGFIPQHWRSGGTEALLKRAEDPEQVAQIREAFYAKYPDLNWIMVTSCPGAHQYDGLRVGQIAALRGQDEFSAAMDVVRISEDAARCCFFSMCEEDVQAVIAHPRAMIGTDSGVNIQGTSYHPRVKGTFPRAIACYVREKGVVSLPEMIRKMTAMPAAVYGLKTKGLIREGFDADLCIFDPNTLQDRADFTNPSQRCVGLDYVIVGGRIAAVNAVGTGELGGKMLFRDL